MQTGAPSPEQQLSPTARRVAVAAIAAALAGLVLLTFIGLVQGTGGTSATGDPAPDFQAALLDGGTFALAEHRGGVTVVNFWASWCPPCREEAPGLERVWRRYRDRGVTFVGVAVEDSASGARGFIDRFDITYQNGLDTEGIARAYRTVGVPETFVVDAEGRIVRRFVGPVTESKLTAAIDDALARGR